MRTTSRPRTRASRRSSSARGPAGLAKPERAIFDHLQRALAADSDDLLFIDDHAGNCDAARTAGWHALHFDSAANVERQLAARGWLNHA